MASVEDINALIAGYTDLKAYYEGQKPRWDGDVAAAQAAYAALAANLVGIIPTENASNGVIFGGTGLAAAKTEARPFDVTTDWTDIVTVGTRGGFKITLSGCDASEGNYGLHVSEHWAVCSENTLIVVPSNIIYNSNTRGFDTQWVGSTFQVRAQDVASNLCAVKVEVISKYFDGRAEILWSEA